MVIKVSNTNQPNWTEVKVNANLPENLHKLQEIAYNLWWVWNSEAKALFRDLNPELWRTTGENPVMVLQRLRSERLKEILADKEHRNGHILVSVGAVTTVVSAVVHHNYNRIKHLQNINCNRLYNIA